MKALDDAHESEYNEKPAIVAKAPGRFHLIGEHSWFFKDKTLSMAINLPIYVALTKRSDSTVKFYFHQLNDRKRANITSLKYKKEDKWANAVKAIIYGYVSGGFELHGMNVTVYSEIFPSAGFGVTTAIKIATALAIKSLFEINISEPELLQVIERGNRRFLMTENYLADNYAALFAKKDTLIITDHFKQTWDYVPFKFEGKSVYLTDTKVPRVSVWHEEDLFEPQNALLLGDLRERKPNVYGEWQYINNVTDINEDLSVVSEDTRRKLLCILSEHSDVLSAITALKTGDFFKFARAVNNSHEMMRDMYEISCPEIDWILKRLSEIDLNLEYLTNPVSCGRITGKGFGRCLYTILRDSDVDKFIQKLGEFEKIFGFHPAYYKVEPSDGARIIQ